ncbi:MAG TPA: hypothetical protein VJN64_04080 [Terriglobales bacterium]|nr:hypothetical protein [Terriglobales bacterium]
MLALLMMEETALSSLSHWENFYVIVGSSAGALTGLQFVVIALIAESETRSSMREVRAFGTPTVVHFCASLLISAILSAPWSDASSIAICLGICGAAGIAYLLRVIWHARQQTGYAPDWGDWFWYAGLPLAGYAILLAGAILLLRIPGQALFVIAATALLLLFIGIHNAWDTVTYIATTREHPGKGK